MKQQVVYFNMPEMQRQLTLLNNGVEKLNELLDENTKLGLIKIKSLNELVGLTRNGERYIKERLIEEIEVPKFSGLRMKPEAFIETLEMPKFHTLNSLAEECKQFVNDMRYYDLKGNKVSIPENIIEQIKNEHSIMAYTAKQMKFAEAHKKTAEAIKDFQNAYKEFFGFPIDQNWKFGAFFFMDESNVAINHNVYRDPKWNTSN